MSADMLHAALGRRVRVANLNRPAYVCVVSETTGTSLTVPELP